MNTLDENTLQPLRVWLLGRESELLAEIGAGAGSAEAAATGLAATDVIAFQALAVATLLNTVQRCQDLFQLVRRLVRIGIVDDVQGVFRHHVLEIGDAAL